MKKAASSERIPWGLLVVFVALVLGISVAARIYYVAQRDRVTRTTQNELIGIAQLKVAQIVTWRAERLGDGKSLAENPFLRDCVTLSGSMRRMSRIERKLQVWLRSYGKVYGYDEVQIFDANVEPLLHGSSEARIDSNDRVLIDLAIRSKGPVFSDLHREEQNDKVFCHVVVPIMTQDVERSEVIGAVFLRIDASQFLYPLIQSWPTSSKSSEIVLVERSGDQITYLTDLRGITISALRFHLPLGDMRLLAAKAVSDSEGAVQGVDYRGIPVIGVICRVPNSQWRLIAKIDLDEVYAVVQEESRNVLIIMLLLTAVAGLLIGLLWRQQRATFYRRSFEIELKRKVVEENFEGLMKFANDGIIILDLQGNILEVNEKAVGLYGWDRSEIIGLNVQKIVAPEAREGARERLDRVRRSSGLVFESIHQRKNGSTFPVEVSARVNAVGDQRFCQIIVRDISDRRLAEQKLREIENRFRSLIENTDDLIVVTSADGYFVFMSPSMERALGVPLEKARTKRFEEFLHLNDLAPTLDVRRKAIENPGQVFAVLHRLKCQDGMWLQVESYVKYVRLSKDTGEIVINARDIEERSRALEALRLSEEKFSKAFRTSPDAISINKLKDGTFIEINDGFAALTGRSKKDVIGKSVSDMKLWVDEGDLKRFARGLVRWGEINDLEAEFVMKDGTRRMGLVSGKLLDVRGERWSITVTRDITERKKAEKLLAENEERMRVALEGAHIAVFNQDIDLRYTWMNIPNVGFLPKDFIGKSDSELLPLQDAEKVVKLKRQVLSSGQGVRAEVPLFWSGVRYIFDMILEPLKNEKHEIVGLTGALMDITERKMAHEQLELQKAYFQQLFETAPEAIVLLTSDERIIEVNPEFTKLFGFTQKEVFNQQINSLIVPEIFKEEGLALTKKVNERSMVSTESVRQRKDGSLVNVSILGRPVHVNGGQIAIYAIYRDITDRKRAEDALRKSETSFRGLFNNVNDAIYIQDRDGRFLDVNQGAEKMYGYPREYFVGKSPEDLAAPGKNDLEGFSRLVQQAFTGEPQQFEFWGKRKNGQIFPKEVRVSKGSYFGQEVVIALAQDITERKQFEATLQETNRTLESLIQASPLAITMMDPECRIQLWNPAAERMFGWKAEEVVGIFNPIVAEDKQAEFIELHKKVMKGEPIQEIEIERKRKDGSYIDISRSTSVVRDAGGNITGVMAVLADITDRKRAVEQLRESEERLRLALTAADMMIWELDLRTEGVTWSESGERFYGLKPNEFKGTREAYVQLIHPDDRPVVEQAMGDSVQKRDEFRSEFRVVWPDGTVHWLAAFGRVICDGAGRPLKVSGIGVDITDRKRTEETIQKLHHAVEQTDEVIIMTEPDGVITYVNPAFEKLYRYSREEVLGKTPRVLKSGGMSQEYYALFWRDLLAGKSIRTEHINKTKDGKIVVVEVSVNSIYDIKGKLTGFISVQEDISERKRNEAERKRLESQLLQTQKLESIGTLAGGIAHDFNNILGIILAYSSSLRNARLPFQKVVNAADIINQAVERGAELVKQILTFARKTDVVYGLVNINAMIKELKRMLAETFPRTITIVTELNPDVQDITADATQVHQAILNICVNARDAMPAGGMLALRTRTVSRYEVAEYFPEASSERYVHVSISDTGTGMDDSTRERIFEPFFTTKPKGKGTGLGLSVVYGVVKNHSGFVRVHSEIGKGTTFELYFPAPVQIGQSSEKTHGSLVDIPGGTESILVIEDEEPLLNVLSGLLKSKGYRVLTARDGYEAVDTYEEHHLDIAVVVSDLGLPKMSGQDAFLRMKSVDPRVKVIFGTGYLDPDLKTELLNLGARGFLAKPYSQDELLRRIRELIDYDKSIDELA